MDNQIPQNPMQQQTQEVKSAIKKPKKTILYHFGQGGLSAIILLIIVWIIGLFLGSSMGIVANFIQAVVIIVVSMLLFFRLGKNHILSIILTGIIFIILEILVLYPVGSINLILLLNQLIWAFVPILIGGYLGMLISKK